MKIVITGRRMDVDDSLRTLIDKKLSRLDKFFRDDAVAHVTLSREKNAERLEVTVSNNGTLFRGEKSDKTFNNALDSVMDIIERQIRRNKTRLGRNLRDGAIKTLSEETGESAEPEEELVTVRRKEFEVGEMSEEEAILQMELLNHDFYMFRNTDDKKIEVVYKRLNGGFGVLVPED
ncbi:MAG: ribosome-associated translation inhibitor RaiA [Clostridia bacterium]|nr:ribosome-associated translation inhibitor RaiA [Clostridia bacterium]